MTNNHFGKCALCGKECELTFEHIPPKKAFNNARAKIVTGDKLLYNEDRMPWDTNGLPYTNQQQGSGKYSLCSECNNNTGSWYAEDYIAMAHAVAYALRQVKKDKYTITIPELHPLRIIKQILSMFCSVNQFDDERIKILRQFVLDKEAKYLDKTKYKVCIYSTRSTITKSAPLTALLRIVNNGLETDIVSEITAAPIGLILYFDPVTIPEYKFFGTDITELADYNYDDIAKIVLPLFIYEVNDLFPLHYRTKEEIKECIEKNKKYVPDFKKKEDGSE